MVDSKSVRANIGDRRRRQYQRLLEDLDVFARRNGWYWAHDGFMPEVLTTHRYQTWRRCRDYLRVAVLTNEERARQAFVMAARAA